MAEVEPGGKGRAPGTGAVGEGCVGPGAVMLPGGAVSGDVVVPVPGNGPAPGVLGIVVPGPVVPPIEPPVAPGLVVPALPPMLPPAPPPDAPPPAPPPPPPPAWATIAAPGCVEPAGCALEAGVTENAMTAAMPVIIIGDISLRGVSVIGDLLSNGGARLSAAFVPERRHDPSLRPCGRGGSALVAEGEIAEP